MILSFRNQATSDFYNGLVSKASRTIPTAIVSVAHRKLDLVNAAQNWQDLRIPPGNRPEALKGNYKGFYSIRINDQYRIIFHWNEGNATDVQMIDYH